MRFQRQQKSAKYGTKIPIKRLTNSVLGIIL
nr:MAG TPA: hypothetical protein [Caudoviricetes sp.]